MNTGELQKYIDQQFSGIENKVSSISWKFEEQKQYIFTTVKNEQYKDIISAANSQATFILGVFSLVIAIAWICLGVYISQKAKQVEVIWKESKDIFTRTENQSNKIVGMVEKMIDQAEKILNQVENTKEDVNRFIIDQEDVIFDRVMKKMYDSYHDSIIKDENNRAHLERYLAATNKLYISEKRYDLFLRFNLVYAYQFFLSKLFCSNAFNNYFDYINRKNWLNPLGWYNNYYEIIEWNRNIFNEYIKNISLKDNLFSYIKWITPIIKNKYIYNIDDHQKIMIDNLEKHMKEVWLEAERNDIIKPSTIPETTTTSQAKTP